MESREISRFPWVPQVLKKCQVHIIMASFCACVLGAVAEVSVPARLPRGPFHFQKSFFLEDKLQGLPSCAWKSDTNFAVFFRRNLTEDAACFLLQSRKHCGSHILSWNSARRWPLPEAIAEDHSRGGAQLTSRPFVIVGTKFHPSFQLPVTSKYIHSKKETFLLKS